MSTPPNTNPTVDPDGTQRWTHNGQLHRLEGPAVVRTGTDGQVVQAQWWWEGVCFEGNEGAHPGYVAYLERQAFSEKQALDKLFPPPPRNPRNTKID